jgi:hypothetical protein
MLRAQSRFCGFGEDLPLTGMILRIVAIGLQFATNRLDDERNRSGDFFGTRVTKCRDLGRLDAVHGQSDATMSG